MCCIVKAFAVYSMVDGSQQGVFCFVRGRKMKIKMVSLIPTVILPCTATVRPKRWGHSVLYHTSLTDAGHVSTIYYTHDKNKCINEEMFPISQKCHCNEALSNVNTGNNWSNALSQIYLHWNWNSKLNTKLRLEFQVEYGFKLEFQVE